MRAARSPLRLWDYCGELEARVRSNTAHSNSLLDGQVPETLVLGKTSDISDIAEFGWYEWVRWRDTRSQFPTDEWTYGRCLGPAATIGGAMGMNVLQPNGQIVIRTTLRKLNKTELTDDKEIKLRNTIDAGIKEKFGNAMKPEDFPEHKTPEWQLYGDDNSDEFPTVPEVDDIHDYDKFIKFSVLLPVDADHKERDNHWEGEG